MPAVLPRVPQPMGPRASARPPLARIDPQFRSLWQGLHIGFVFNDADAAVDVVTGRRYAWSGDDGATVPSPWGRVVDFNGNSSGTHFVIPDADIGVIPDQTTMFVVFRLDAVPVAGDQYIFEILSDEASSFTWTVNYRVGKDGTDANKLKQSIAYSNSTATASSSDLVVGEWYRNHLIQAEDISEFWFNGHLDNRVSSTLGSITDRSNNWNIGKREGFTNRNFEGPIAMVLLYKRRLSVPEVRLQAADPFGMFRPWSPVGSWVKAGAAAATTRRYSLPLSGVG